MAEARPGAPHHDRSSRPGLLDPGLEEKWLIKVPLDVVEHGIVFPHFADAFSRPELYGSLLLIIITLTLIDGTESLATIAASDKIDPFKRKSNPNVTLRAMGVSNTASSLLGGLTIIPGGVKARPTCSPGCSHKVFKRIFSVGKEQIFVAMVNVVVTLATSDILDGMIVGTLTKILLLVKDVVRASANDPQGRGWGAP